MYNSQFVLCYLYVVSIRYFCEYNYHKRFEVFQIQLDSSSHKRKEEGKNMRGNLENYYFILLKVCFYGFVCFCQVKRELITY